MRFKKNKHFYKNGTPPIKLTGELGTCSIAFCRFSSMSESILEFSEKRISTHPIINGPTETSSQQIPGLAEVKRLPLDFLLVDVYWEKTGHFIDRPVKLGRRLRDGGREAQSTFLDLNDGGGLT